MSRHQSDIERVGWPTGEESLDHVAAELGKGFELLSVLDAFGDDGEVESISQVDDRFDEVAFVRTHRCDE